MSLKEYDIDDTAIAEWLPWGGLVHPNVMKNKDGSFFGIIEYKPYLSQENRKIKDRKYQNGWIIWSEKQHWQGTDHYFLTISWNPFYDRLLKAENTLHSYPVYEKNAAAYFAKEMESFAEDISVVTTCQLLAYQEILDFLSFTLSLGENSVIMPQVPLYLDVLLSKDLNAKFLENGISINGKQMLVLTLPAIPEMPIMGILYKAFESIPYRYVQRLLLFDKNKAQEDLEKYVSKWCSGRKSLRKMMVADILSNLNGYYSASLIFLLPDEIYNEMRDYCKAVLDTLECPYFLENYNLKDVWWGSLPSVFRANITAPICGFMYLDELLVQYQNVKEAKSYVSTESI